MCKTCKGKEVNIMIYKNLAIAVTGGALLLGTFASAAFADDNHHDMSMSHESSAKSSSSNWNGNDYQNNWYSKNGRTLFTLADGRQEVPGPGDPNGYGFIKVKAQPEKGKLCVSGKIRNIEPATAAHIHEAPRGQAGPVVVNLPTPNERGHINGCVDAPKDILEDIVRDPSDYYFNAHNTTYPGGAVRGQL